MIRVIIKNTSGVQISLADMEDPTQWIASGESNNWWGLPGTYTITNTDVTAEYKQSEIDTHIAQIQNDCETKVQAILAPLEKTTYLMMAIYDVAIASNSSGTESQLDIAASKSRIATHKVMMAQIQELRIQRDQAIAAYLASVGSH